MDCFTDFYERLDILTTIQEPELDENGEPLVDEFTSDLSAGIAEEYFEKVDQASSLLLNYNTIAI